MERRRITVAPAGVWGSTLGKILADNGQDVTFVFRTEEGVDSFIHHRELAKKLPGIVFPETIHATSDIPHSLENASMLIFGPPSQHFREFLEQYNRFLSQDLLLVSISKGLEVGSNFRMSQIVSEIAPHLVERMAVVSGPNLASEVAQGLPACTVVAAKKDETVCTVQSALHTSRFRVYRSHDVIGVELGGAMKNVIALAAGISDGLQLGQNARAGLINRGLYEMKKIGVALGGHENTFNGLSGEGDLNLTATATNPESRNHWAGRMLGEGKTLEWIEKANKTVEGIQTAKAVRELAHNLGIEVPIMSCVARIVQAELNLGQAADLLMKREFKEEFKRFS